MSRRTLLNQLTSASYLDVPISNVGTRTEDMKLRHRVSAYAVNYTDPDYSEWTTEKRLLEEQIQWFRDHAYDWIYIEAEGMGHVAFDGEHTDLESVHDYMKNDLG